MSEFELIRMDHQDDTTDSRRSIPFIILYLVLLRVQDLLHKPGICCKADQSD